MVSPKFVDDITSVQDQDVTCESLALVVQGGDQLLRTLRIVNYDLTHIDRGKRIVCALDYSDLHEYLWPASAHSHTPQVTRALLDSTGINFTLPPGASLELLRRIQRIATGNVATRRYLDRISNRPLAAKFVEFFEQQAGGTSPLADIIGRVVDADATMSQLSKSRGVLSRLASIQELESYIPFGDLLLDSDYELRPDPAVFEQCLMSLTFNRPGDYEINNIVDAHNYALVWSLSNAHYDTRDTLYTLVTSSPVPSRVFRRHTWRECAGIPDTSLVRHPIHIAYLSQIQKHGDDSFGELKILLSDLAKVIRHWTGISSYKKYLDHKIDATAPVRLPRNKDYVRAYASFLHRYNEFFAPVRTAIESDVIAEENKRQLHNIGLEGASARVRVLTDKDHSPGVFRIRQVFRLLDIFSRLLTKAIKEVKGGLATLPADLLADIDVEGLVVSPSKIKIKSKRNSEFNCTEVIATETRRNNVFFCGDVYDDYYSLWWNTDVSLSEFVTAVRLFVLQATAEKKRRASNWAKSEHDDDGEKMFNGIYLFRGNGAEPIKKSLSDYPDLQLQDLLEIARSEPNQPVVMIKLAFEFGDLCYDLSSYQGIPQRAGILSHRPLAKPIAYLLRRTGSCRPDIRESERVIRRAINLGKRRRDR